MSGKTYQVVQVERTPERVLPFLRSFATNKDVRHAMVAAGYGDADQAEGWRLVLAATGYAHTTPVVSDDVAARQAIVELDAWDEPGYQRIHAALERLHPEQDAFVFAGLESGHGPSAVLGVARMLDRLDQLEQGSEADQAAIATLTKRGITPALRQQLRQLVTTAQAATALDPTDPGANDAAQQQALAALYAWYRDWSATARAVIKRRDLLILMGLAKRHANQDAPPVATSTAPTSTPAATPATTTTPAVTPAPASGAAA